jgi:NitT/TauT family transport system substrate-binding protein
VTLLAHEESDTSFVAHPNRRPQAMPLIGGAELTLRLSSNRGIMSQAGPQGSNNSIRLREETMKLFSEFVAKTLVGAAVGVVAFAASAQAQDLKAINVISPNDASCGVYPQFNAEVFGFWTDSGVKATLLPSETTVPFVAFLQNGDADLVMLDSAQVLQAADAGLPIKVLYEAYNFAPEGIVVTADSPIQGLADLKDVTIGMASDRDLITTVIAMDSIGKTLEDNNITTVVVGDSGPVMASSLTNRTIDAFAGGGSDRAGIEAAGVKIRNITPAAVSRNPGNSWTAWGPTIEEKRGIIEPFLRGWAMAQHAGVVDTKLSASACRTIIPEQFENLEVGMNMLNNSIYVQQLRRTKDYGELQPDVWAAIEGPYVKLGEISKFIEPDTFLDASFIAAANNWTLDQVKAGMARWKEENADRVIN